MNTLQSKDIFQMLSNPKNELIFLALLEKLLRRQIAFVAI